VQFLQINLHHSKAASAALLTRLATGNIDVVVIQEPWIVGNNIPTRYERIKRKNWIT